MTTSTFENKRRLLIQLVSLTGAQSVSNYYPKPRSAVQLSQYISYADYSCFIVNRYETVTID